MNNSPIHVTSEIGKLKEVLLKRPGKELENLTPEYLGRLLFDDIPYLPQAQKEHDTFAQVLQENGAECFYLEKLTAESFTSPEIRKDFVEKMVQESYLTVNGQEEALLEYFSGMGDLEVVEKLMSGVRVDEVDRSSKRLIDHIDGGYPFLMDPMPNLYFTRDPAASIGDGMTVNKMFWEARRREAMFMEYVLKYHPKYKDSSVNVWLDRYYPFNIEGGDELVLAEDVIALGISERTSAQAVEELARQLFAKQDKIKTILGVDIGSSRAFMHLDTVFTMVDVDKFTIHPGIQGEGGKIDTYVITKGENGELNIELRTDLKKTLEEFLKRPIEFIPCGGGDPIISAREQWNDGSNTLTIAPGVVVTYDRNYVSNELLRKAGIKVIEITGSELVRGRGGPRCMSQPLVREDVAKG